jgi:putative membrane protein
MSSEFRLHPLSPLFAVITHAKRYLITLVIAFFASRGSSENSTFVIAMVVIATLDPIVRYFTFRYRYDETELVIRSGILTKNERHIPYDRIQNIDAVQTLVHRMLGVVTVVVQTGSGQTAEATLAVLPIAALDEMRTRVFAGASARAGVRAGVRTGVSDGVSAGVSDGVSAGAIAPTAGRFAAALEPPETILHLSPGELLLCGLIESRGIVLIASAAAFVLSQIDNIEDNRRAIPWLSTLYQSAERSFSQGGLPLHGILLGVGGIIVLMVCARLIGAVWTAVRLFDFRVTKHGDDLRVEHGFFTRVVNTIPLRRIQWVVVSETIPHRLLDRVSVRVTTAGGILRNQEGGSDRGRLAPILPRAALPALLAAVQPGLDLDVPLHPAHPRGIRRAMTVGSIFPIVAALTASYWIGGWAVAVFLVLEARAIVSAILLMRNLGWATTESGVVFRGGRLRRHIAATRFSRMQTISVQESPFDRRTQMATLLVDTAGVRGAHLEMQYLPRADALALKDLLGAKTADTAFAW